MGLDRIMRTVLYAVALGFVAHRALVPMAETDLFFHLKIGDLIRAEHAIPFRNLFSFTYPDAHDPDLCWAFQVLVSLLHAAGGFTAIVLGKAALLLAAAALVHRASRRAGAGPTAAALATVLALCAADQRLVERPHLVTFVGIGALSCLLAEVRNGRARLLWWLPLLTLVWANFHAGVFFCALVTTLWLIGRRLDGALPLPSARLAIILALTAAASVVTPAGLELPRYLLWHTGLGSTRVIEEFRRANPYSDPWFFALIAICIGGAVRFGRAQLDKSLPAIVVALLALRSVRFVAEWAFLVTPLVALALEAMGALVTAPRLRRAGAIAAASAVLLVIVEERRDRPFALGLDPKAAPYAAIRFVTERGLRDRLYVDLEVGCYLLWEGWPRYRVFQDARLPAYPDEMHRALDQTPLSPAAFDALLRRYGVDAALLNEPDVNMRAGSFDPEEWALVYRAEDALVFARRTEAHRALIAERELPLRLRFAFVGGTSVEPLRAPPPRSPVPRCEWDRRLARALDEEARPDAALEARVAALEHGCLSPREEASVRYYLGAAAQREGRLERATSEYDRALELDPRHRGARLNRAYARLLSDVPAALEDFLVAYALPILDRLALR